MGKLTLSSRTKIVLLSLSGVVLLYALAGFLLLPAVLSRQIPKLAQEKLHRSASVDAIHFNPFSLEFSIDGFTLMSQDDNPFASFGQFYVNLNVWRSIIDLTLTFDHVKLAEPYLYVERGRNGVFNFTDLMADEQTSEDTKTDDGELFPLTLALVTISQGKLTWEDHFHQQSQREHIEPIDLTLSNLTTRIDGKSQLGFSLMFASGGSLDWQGTLGLNPLFSKGHIKLEKISFRRLWQLFLKHSVAFEILTGREVLEADYHLTDDQAMGVQLLVDNAHVGIYEVKISEPDREDALITIPSFAVSGITANLQQRTVTIADIAATDAAFTAWLNADGTLNFQSLFLPQNPESASAAKSDDQQPLPPWLIRIDRLALQNFALHFVDKTLPKPAQIELTAIDFKSRDLSSKDGSSVPIDLALLVNNGGKVSIKGSSILQPFQADLQIEADAIALADFQPYLDKAAKLDIVSGLFGADFRIKLLPGENRNLNISVHGDSRISDFVSKDRISNQDFIKWQQLTLHQMNLDLAANDYRIDTITLKHPYSRVLIKQDKSTNINDVLIAKAESSKPRAEQTETATPKQPTPTFKIGRIDISGGQSDFADLSLILPFSAHIDRLQGSISGISSARNDSATIKLDGTVGELAPVNIEGEIYPNRGDSEIALNFDSMPMPLITPYMAEFAGRKIEKGNLSLKLHYKIRNQQLSASNNLLIEDLVLGEKVDNPKAVSLPLDLAIALLEDSNGEIALDVPITGSLEDPQFSVADIVVDALANVITKIVSSPFNAIASLIEGGEDVSQIAFPAGQSTLTDNQRNKLDELASALAQRPKLKLEIKGTAFTKQDWPALQEDALRRRLLQMRADELNREDGKKRSADDIQLSDEDYQRLLADLFIQRYPHLAERSFFGTPRLLDPNMGNFYQVAQSKLAAAIPPDEQRLRKLANDRARAIAKYLIAAGIPVKRLFMLDAGIDPKEAGLEPVALLNLTVD